RLRRGGSLSVSACALLVAVLGLRVGEAVGLRLGNVRADWLVVSGKSGEREVPLTSAAKEVLGLSSAETPEAWLFPSRKGSACPHVRESSVTHHVRRVCDGAGLHHVHTHWLRHAYASWLVCNGFKLKTVSRLLGHTSVWTTERYYVHLTDREQHEAAEAVGRSLTRVLGDGGLAGPSNPAPGE
ncbi:MAG: site-specific integrase, partial [Deltaproteobacteria bacterium]|nr:site-specific integrase [Deltaproteobacteria bacterium]